MSRPTASFEQWFATLSAVRRPRLKVIPCPYDAADPLSETFRRRPDIARSGRLYWGFIHLANGDVWSGEGDAPAGVLYSPDPLYVRYPDRLAPIAERLAALHGNDRIPRDPEWRYTADGERTGLERRTGERLPLTMTGGRLVFTSSLYVQLKHLLNGRLTDHVVPLWVDDDGYAITVPCAVWPEGFRDRFTLGT